MASQGPNSPGTGADDSSVGTKTWVSPGNIVNGDSDEANASGFPTSSSITHYLKATGFGFSIPGGSTIDGIVVEIQRRGTVTSSNKCYDNNVRLVKGGAYVGSDKANTGVAWPSTLTYATYGSSSDLWGTSWTASEVNASNFGVGLTSLMTCDGKNGVSSLVDHIRITVYYTAGGGGGSQVNALLMAGD